MVLPLSNSRVSLYIHTVLRLLSFGASAIVATLYCYFVWETRHHFCRANPLDAMCRHNPVRTAVPGVYITLILASVLAAANAILGTAMLIHATLSTDRIHGAPPPLKRLFTVDFATLLLYAISFGIYTAQIVKPQHVLPSCTVQYETYLPDSVPARFCVLTQVAWSAVLFAMGFVALCSALLGVQIVAERGRWWQEDPQLQGVPGMKETA